jgi:hypothetical protein
VNTEDLPLGEELRNQLRRRSRTPEAMEIPHELSRPIDMLEQQTMA